MSDQFNQLLLQTLKEVGIRLERLEGRVDHVINEKADKSDISDVKSDISDVKTDVKSDVSSVKSQLNGLQEEMRSLARRVDRIETGIRTLQWTMTAGLAVLGIILAFIKVL